MPIHAPKISVLGAWTPKRDWSSSRPSKGTSLTETALILRFWWRSVKRCDLDASRRYQKGEERKKPTAAKTGCSPRPPTLTQRHVVLHAWLSLGDSYKFQVSSKSVQRCSRYGRSNFAISYCQWLITACTNVLPYNPSLLFLLTIVFLHSVMCNFTTLIN